jgi:hypothetical protein
MRRRGLDSTSEREPDASLRGTIHRVSLFREAVSGSPGRIAADEAGCGRLLTSCNQHARERWRQTMPHHSARNPEWTANVKSL